MNTVIHIIGLISLFSLAAGTASAGSAEQSKVIDTGPFTFKAPSSLQSSKVQGTDSLVGRYTNDTLELQFDYGWYSDPLKRPNVEKRPGYREFDLVVDGVKAYIIAYDAPNSGKKYRHMMAIHFPDAGDGRTRLTIHTWCRSTNDYAVSETIFRSIQFKKKAQPPGADGGR